MPHEHRIGDLFAQSDVDALAHGVNCSGVAGGIAAVFFSRWKSLNASYREDVRHYRPGKAYAYKIPKSERVNNERRIYNLTSQKYPGANAKPAWLEGALREMVAHAENHDVRGIAVPMIGAGIGGLTVDCVTNCFERVGADTVVNLVSVEMPS